MELKHRKKYLLIIYIIVILSEQFFYLISDYKIWVSFIFVLTLILCFWWLSIKRYKRNGFKVFILSFFSLNIISCLMTVIVWGQPLQMALLKYRYTFCILLYFPVSYIVSKITAQKTIDVIINLALFILIVTLVQKMIFPSTIIKAGLSVRNGMRTFQSEILVCIALLLAMCKFFLEKHRFFARIKLAIFIGLSIYYIIFIAQSRGVDGCIAATLLYLIVKIIGRKLSDRSKIAWRLPQLLFSIVGLIIIYNYFQGLVTTSLNVGESSSINRVGAIHYYLSQFIKYPILGRGLYYSGFSQAAEITGANYNWYMDDVGIFGFIFVYGLAGCILLIKLYHDIIVRVRYLDSTERLLCNSILLFFTAILPFNCLLYMGIAYLCIMLAVLDYYSHNKDAILKQ